MPAVPILTTRRLRLEAFTDADISALAAILAEPEVTRNITANGSTPERCRSSAVSRVNWHNGSWREHGYGVWAVREGKQLIGWCGFAPPDIGEDPEILYGLAPTHWGRGLALEAIGVALDWVFAETRHGGVSAVIFGRINPASTAIARKFGMTLQGIMDMADFLPDRALAADVLDYEIWRLAAGRCRDPDALLFQAPYKGGQIASLGIRDTDSVEQAFCDAARSRDDFAATGRMELEQRVRQAFHQGVAEPYLDWYHLDREDWPLTI